MSLPTFPTITPSLTREDAINQILSSIAMEELGLSHIINAEGEKIQYVLGTLEGSPDPKASIEDILKVNESVRSVLQSAAENQTLLRTKMQAALNSSVMVGPPGPPGEAGAGSIISLSSRGIIYVKTDIDGNPEYASLVGIGTSDMAAFVGDDIILTDLPEKTARFSIIVPRKGTITELHAHFYTDNEQTLPAGVSATITVQIYEAKPNVTDDVFTRIASVSLAPEVTSETPGGRAHIGTVAQGLPVTVDAGSRLILAYKTHSNQDIRITGYATASFVIT